MSSENTSSTSAPNLEAPPEGFGRRADGTLIPVADMVQGPSDIQAQFHQDTIPEQFAENIERNRAAGLDSSGHPIPGATLSPAALAVVGDLAPPAPAAPPREIPPSEPSDGTTGGDATPVPAAPRHVAVPVEHVSAFTNFLHEVKGIPAYVLEYWHEHFGRHV